MAKKEMLNDWTLYSEDFDFEVFSNGNKVIIQDGTDNRTQIFEGKIESAFISIYDMTGYYCNIEIEYFSKVIKFVKIDEGYDE